MSIEEILSACPSLEHFLRVKEGRLARLLEAALVEAIDDIQDPNKPAAAVRAVKFAVSMRPDADRSSVRVEMKDPSVKLAEREAEAAQLYIVDTSAGAQLQAPNLNQETIRTPAARGAGLRTTEEAS